MDSAGHGERVAIVGSRNFARLESVREYVQQLPLGTTVVSGGARGVDATAEQEAHKRGLPVATFRPDWDKHGRGAGFIRNHSIIEYATRVVAFHDGSSRGTQHSIDLARQMGKPVDIRYT